MLSDKMKRHLDATALVVLEDFSEDMEFETREQADAAREYLKQRIIEDLDNAMPLIIEEVDDEDDDDE